MRQRESRRVAVRSAVRAPVVAALVVALAVVATGVTTAGASVRAASATGVDRTSVKIALLDGDIKQLVDLGFAVPLGDVAAQAKALVDDVNAHGGVNGRKLVLVHHESSILDSASGQAACIAATEDDKVFAVISPNSVNGSVAPCVAQQHHTPMIMLGGTQEDLDKAHGMLFSASATSRTMATTGVKLLAGNGYFKGKRVGIISDSFPASKDAVDNGYLPALKAAGVKAVANQVLSCATASNCSGYPTAVQAFKRAGVDVVLTTLGPLSYPAFVAEADREGLHPLYTATGMGGMTSDVVAKQQAKNGDAFDGAIGVAGASAGAYSSAKPPAFNEECAKIYAEHGGPRYTLAKNPSEYGGLGVVCSMVRIVQRGLEGAGRNPTQQSFSRAVQHLDPVELNNSEGSFGPTKLDAQDQYLLVRWSKDCVCWQAISKPTTLR
jgi:ABC-type branched-subunit amino acid transport system substrate-binding protein